MFDAALSWLTRDLLATNPSPQSTGMTPIPNKRPLSREEGQKAVSERTEIVQLGKSVFECRNEVMAESLDRFSAAVQHDELLGNSSAVGVGDPTRTEGVGGDFSTSAEPANST